MGTMPPCPGGAAGMPQQQTPMMNSQGVPPAVFRPAQAQVCATSKSELGMFGCMANINYI
jgi:hypothetical protein